MVLQLRDDGNVVSNRDVLKRIPLVHCAVLVTWLFILVKITRVYGSLYEKSALIATYCSNMLLFGLSDALAQTIACVGAREIDPVPRVINDAAQQLQRQFRTQEPEDISDDDFSVFNDYGPHDLQIEAFDSDGGLAPNTDSFGGTIRDIGFGMRFNFYRWLCFMIWGWFISNFQVPWYKLLNYIYSEDPTLIQVLKRVLTDQLLYSPLSLYGFFLYSNYIIEHGNEETFTHKIEKLYLSTLGCNYIVWPAVQFINFLVMPKRFQVPFSSSIGVLWNCFLSMRTAATR
ncbi:HBL356Wp [Eremothecium sinecaudum]|uniref:HBL356Wp n=1 Tax=Eremothecium sinecaudum TaxID=45286 RepID=A0A125RDT5_9SACH|nr:HBL356Wp [Eremothecium sinecaudum]AMD18546.1 HBL356Wp [Eremothecium sinecaudum]